MGGGGFNNISTEERIRRTRIEGTHTALMAHPNFYFPVPPRIKTVVSVADYTAKVIANYISPTKVEGENDEFACEIVTAAIETLLLPLIKQRLIEVAPLE